MSIPLSQAFVSVALALALVAAAADTPAQSHRCTTVKDPAARLACYDAAFPPAAGARSAVDVQAEKEQGLRDFGLSRVQLRERDPDRMREVSPGQIEAAVTRIDTRGTGERILTLDSGQMWLLTEVTSRGRLSVGDRIVVREAALGSYMVLTPKRVALRARRIK